MIRLLPVTEEKNNVRWHINFSLYDNQELNFQEVQMVKIFSIEDRKSTLDYILSKAKDCPS